MQGVVIWYSRKDFRAIIWGEDSRELGIACGATAWHNPMSPVEVGDYVAFRAEQRGRDRMCRDIRLIESQAAPSLPAAIIPHPPRPAVSRNRLLHLCASRD